MNTILTQEELERIIRNSYNEKEEVRKYAPLLILEILQSVVEYIFKSEVSDVEKRVSAELESCSRKRWAAKRRCPPYDT